MIHRANLFHAKKRGSQIEIIKPVFRTLSAVVVFLLVILIGIFILEFQIKQEEQTLLAKKAELLTYMLDNKNLEAKILFFSAKKKQLTTFQLDDAHFLPYYRLLSTILLSATGSPTLQSMTIDKGKQTAFTVNFPDFQKAYEFIKVVESPSFLNKFSQLTLNSFTISTDQQNNVFGSSHGYQLQLSGTFYDIPQETN